MDYVHRVLGEEDHPGFLVWDKADAKKSMALVVVEDDVYVKLLL